MVRSISSTMLTAQAGTKKTPYIRVVINSVDLSSRLLFVEHIEEPYRDRTTLVFRNNDRYFDSLDFQGFSFQPGYGFTTGAGNEYCGDGTSDGTPTMWVKVQEIISTEGMVVCNLYCEGEWMYLREQKVVAVGTAPLYQYTFNESSNDYTIYDLIEMAIETVMGWTLEAAIDGGSDGIIDVIYPKISVNVSYTNNVVTLDSYAEFLYSLISMTKCYLRQKSATNWELVYPQENDEVDETYYSSSVDGHPFTEHMERMNEVVPNRIYVAANHPGFDDGEPWPAFPPAILGDSGAYTGNYDEVAEIHLYPWVTSQGTADLLASAIMTKLKSESLAGRTVVPHDCRVELYDKIRVEDNRGL